MCIPVYGDMGAEELFVVGCRRELDSESNFRKSEWDRIGAKRKPRLWVPHLKP